MGTVARLRAVAACDDISRTGKLKQAKEESSSGAVARLGAVMNPA